MSDEYRKYLDSIKADDMITIQNGMGDKRAKTVIRVTKTMIVCRDWLRFSIKTGKEVYRHASENANNFILMPEDKP